MTSVCLMTGDGHFDHSVKVGSVRFFFFQVTIA